MAVLGTKFATTSHGCLAYQSFARCADQRPFCAAAGKDSVTANNKAARQEKWFFMISSSTEADEIISDILRPLRCVNGRGVFHKCCADVSGPWARSRSVCRQFLCWHNLLRGSLKFPPHARSASWKDFQLRITRGTPAPLCGPSGYASARRA